MDRTFLPLHPAQRDVYVDQLIHINSAHYNIGGYIQLRGLLNIEIFREVVRTTPDVFDAFKQRFNHTEAEPVCFIDDEFEKQPLPQLDFSSHANPAESAKLWMQTSFNTPIFIKTRSLPFEECLLKIAENEHWFFGKYHHLITDGYGFIVLVDYLAKKYRSLVEGERIEFDYPSYNEELESAFAYFSSPEYEKDALYWKTRIAEIPKKILPGKYLSNTLDSKISDTFILELTSDQQKLLEELQVKTKAGIQQLSTAALLIFFGKTSEQNEFVFGIPVHKRGSRKLRNIVGMFSGVLACKVAYEPHRQLAELIKEIASAQKADYRHQHYPIGDLGRNLKATASEGYLYQVSIDYEPLNFKPDFGNQLQAAILRVPNDQERNPLQLCWLDYGNDQPLRLQVHYGNAFFNKTEIELFVKRILFIMEQFSAALHQPIGQIAIVPAWEKALLDKWNNTTKNYPANKTIVNLFEDAVAKFPHNIALVFEHSQLTYKELNERSNQLAHFLIKKGVQKESLIPICIHRSVEMLVGILGVLKAGAAYVPIEPGYPDERVRFMLEDCNATIVITNSEAAPKIITCTAAHCILLNEEWPAISKESVHNPDVIIQPKQLAYIIYTSGSTGKPKGVMIEHSGVVNLVTAQTAYFGVDSTERILQFSNFCFDASVEQIFLALFNGASLYLVSEGVTLNIDLFDRYLKENKITHLHATPSFLENLHSIETGSLKRMIAGGDICKKELSAHWKQRLNFYNEYGPTETTITALEYHDQPDQPVFTYSLPIGRPVANTRLYIVDQHKNLLPIGVAGELYIAGAGVARGYLNRPELTAEKFIPNTFSSDAAQVMYNTGDLARWLPDGNIEYLGRIDEQVKIRGFRIELGEIENVLQELEMVRQAVVLAREDAAGNKRLVGYIVPEGKFDKDLIQIRLRKKLPDYMVPALWVPLQSLPLTTNGKVDRKALPGIDASELVRNEYAAPENEMELSLAAIWKEILMVNKVGVTDNFFELGGHSLNAIQLTSRLHKRLNIKIDIGTIFSNPTIRQLSLAIAREKQQLFVEINRLPNQEYYPLSHAQKRFWILSHFKDGSAAYNVASAFSIDGYFNIDAFKKAFDVVIERHEILRTVFVESAGEPMQKILSADRSGFEIETIDLQQQANPPLIIKQWLEADAKRPFDLTNGPLLRAAVFQESAARFVLVFNIHHIISDGWSKGILIKEVLHSYQSFCKAIQPVLLPLSIQYKDYASWHSTSFAYQGQYWRNQFKNGIPVLNFPVDFERPKVLSFFGSMLQSRIPESLTQDLRKKAIESKMSLNNLLFALYGLVTARLSGQDEVVIGSLSSGRSHLDLENLVGVFINFLPVKLAPKRSLNFSAYLESSNEVLVQAYNNQDYPFDLMVEECIAKRDMSRNPFFDTMVNFHLQNEMSGREEGPASEATAETGLIIKPYKEIQEDLFQSVLDFKLDIEPAGNALDFYLSYNSKLFKKETMQSFMDELLELLRQVVDEPGKSLQDYGIWMEEENIVSDNHMNETTATIPEIPLNICASFVVEPVQEFVEYWSNEMELNVRLSFAPYNQVFQQLVNPGSLLNTAKGLNVLFIRLEDWLREKAEESDSGQVNFLQKTFIDFIKAIENAGSISFVPFLIGIVPVSESNSFSVEVVETINRLNQLLEKMVERQPCFHELDLAKIARLYEVEEIFDPKSDELGHMPFSQEFYAALGTYLARKANAFKGSGYKVIALDCDNTLWKGVCGELGAMEVIIDDNFSSLQDFMIEKYQQGYLLVLCSKNNEADVWEVFDLHPKMKLKRSHIAAHRINWEPKSGNLLSVATELNLGIGSFIYLDDSEFEIEQMSAQCPDVFAIPLPDSTEDYRNFLDHIWAFDTFRVTDEDTKRNQQYQLEKQRKEEQGKFGSLEDFLETLDINVTISPLTDNELERAVQLTLRTNQFNLNGIRKTPGEIAGLMQQENVVNWVIEVKDRFGDYGIVGLVLAEIENDALQINTFLLSCRVLGRNVEDYMLIELQKYAEARGLTTMTALFQTTEKNKPFDDFLTRTKWVTDPVAKTYKRPLKITDKISA